MLFIVDHFWFWKVYYNEWKQQPRKPIKSWGCNMLKGWKSTNSVDLTKENVPGGIVNFMCQMKSIKCVIFHEGKTVWFLNHFVNYINAVIRLKKSWACSRSTRPVSRSHGICLQGCGPGALPGAGLGAGTLAGRNLPFRAKYSVVAWGLVGFCWWFVCFLSLLFWRFHVSILKTARIKLREKISLFGM